MRKDGGEISVELSLSPISSVDDTNRSRRFVLAIVRDVTERKGAQGELDAEAERGTVSSLGGGRERLRDLHARP